MFPDTQSFSDLMDHSDNKMSNELFHLNESTLKKIVSSIGKIISTDLGVKSKLKASHFTHTKLKLYYMSMETSAYALATLLNCVCYFNIDTFVD